MLLHSPGTLRRCSSPQIGPHQRRELLEIPQILLQHPVDLRHIDLPILMHQDVPEPGHPPDRWHVLRGHDAIFAQLVDHLRIAFPPIPSLRVCLKSPYDVFASDCKERSNLVLRQVHRDCFVAALLAMTLLNTLSAAKI